MARCDHPGATCVMGMNYYVCDQPSCSNYATHKRETTCRPADPATRGYIVVYKRWGNEFARDQNLRKLGPTGIVARGAVRTELRPGSDGFTHAVGVLASFTLSRADTEGFYKVVNADYTNVRVERLDWVDDHWEALLDI